MLSSSSKQSDIIMMFMINVFSLNRAVKKEKTMDNIQTKRVLLRPFRLTDVKDVHAYSSDEDVTKYMLFGPNTLEETKSFLTFVVSYIHEQPQRHFEYAIELNQHVIGAVSLHLNESRDEAEIGWVLHKKYQRQGIMYEAASALKHFAINTFRLQRIIAHCDSRNVASYKLMEKLGMHYVSIEKGITIRKKQGTVIRDELLYALDLAK